jgi:hypothetical protein
MPNAVSLYSSHALQTANIGAEAYFAGSKVLNVYQALLFNPRWD